MNLTVSGRYLLLRETWQSGLDKAGFADHSRFDLKLLHALSESIAIVEQLCTLPQGSVIDYRADGSPVRETNSVKSAQSDVRDHVQKACIDYCATSEAGFVFQPLSDTPETRRRMATASLARLLFLPVESEVQVLSDFDHDVNLGTSDLLKFIDVDAAAQGLRRRGIFYIKNALRMYLPGELRQHGLPINLSIFASRRFGLDLRKTDFDVGAIQLPVMLMDAHGQHMVMDVDAVPTIEGYYQALVPIGAAQFTVGVQLGRIAQWVQVDETSFHPVAEFLDAKAQEVAISRPCHPRRPGGCRRRPHALHGGRCRLPAGAAAIRRAVRRSAVAQHRVPPGGEEAAGQGRGRPRRRLTLRPPERGRRERPVNTSGDPSCSSN